ncbi:hypothetical protein F5Y18DRAFT_98203 [Xylariaceae sp. FL1019]|nr:hypothetical protein F5Y18DRAFT_98203 [Xylariaceae sp. FL1019]
MAKSSSLIPRTCQAPIGAHQMDTSSERIILHFDYDCFYASVFENENPSLKSQPLGIKQKSILATCNYVARARGVKKLMLISEAQRICPDLILMNGEDLTRFRDVSKKLWAFLRAHSWNHRVERLGLDEVFLDVTDIIAYNADMLNVHALSNSFFQLDRNDPVKGFPFNAAQFYACVQPPPSKPEANGAEPVEIENALCVRLMLASHLTGYLRHRLDEDFGYTSSGGISTNKVLAKLAGSVNKPNNQTTLLSYGDASIERFMDAHTLRKVPGIGSRTAQLVEEHILSAPAVLRDREGSVTVSEVRQSEGMSARCLEKILDRPGAERGSGEKIWNLLHGVDPSEVKEASDVPTQISIEDTYMTQPLQTTAEVTRELSAIATSLIRRMRVDLTEVEHDLSPAIHDAHASSSLSHEMSLNSPRWLAYPKTLRLSTRKKSNPVTNPSSTSDMPQFSRSSRSVPLPSFVFSLSASPADDIAGVAERLVTESLLPLFRRLHPERQSYNLALLNVCVTNMVIVANDDNSTGSKGSGRDISRMFRTQEEKLREFTVYDTSALPESPRAETTSKPTMTSAGDAQQTQTKGEVHPDSHIPTSTPYTSFDDQMDDMWDEEEEGKDEDIETLCCETCGHEIAIFAMPAHRRFHALDE